MEMSEKKKTPLSDLMDASLAKIREMVDSNTVVGQPITTPDGVTLIPVSRLSFGFGAGGSDYGKQPTPNFGGGAGAGVKVEQINQLLKQFDMMNQMVKQFSGPGASKKMKRMGKMGGFSGGMGGFPGM